MGRQDDRDELLRLETALASRDPAGTEGGLKSLIAEDFVEFGKSGRVGTARSIRDHIQSPVDVSISIEAFEVAELAEGVVLATYVLPGSPSVNRSSIWVNRDGQ
jgi:glyoxylase I family protein